MISRPGVTVMAAVLGVTAASVAILIGVPPKGLPDRLAKIPDDAVHIDNDMYDAQEFGWDQEDHPLKLMNRARIPYFVTTIRKHLGEGKHTLLDVGCGGGLATIEMAAAGLNVTGLDMSSNSIKIASHLALKRGIDVKYVVGSAYKLPFEDGSFDAVLSSDVLEHLQDLPTALVEIERVLRPGGIFVFDTINRTLFSWAAIVRVAQDLLGYIPASAHSWLLFVTPQEIRKALEDVKLQPCSLKEHVGMGPSVNYPFTIARKLYEGKGVAAFFGPWNRLPSVMGSYLGYATKPSS